MSVENTVDINLVPPDIDPLEVGVVKNPLTEDFTHAYGGKDLTIPAKGEKQFPLYVAVHLSKHFAEKIIRDENRKRILKIANEKVRDEQSRKAIPDYKGKIWELMRELVVTDSDFFGKKDEKGEEENKAKFIK